MEVVGDEYILRKIFHYLNGESLNNSAKVNRLWNKLAKEEFQSRGPFCSYADFLTGLPEDWDDIRNDTIDICGVKPILHIGYFFSGFAEIFSEECICSSLPHYCHSIAVESYYISEEEVIISNMFFPTTQTIEINTLTFNVHAWEYGIFCDELNVLFDFYFENNGPLRYIFDPLLNDNSNLTNCLILLYEETKEFIGSNILRYLHKSYPNRVSSIWGGMVKNISICKKLQEISVCRHDADCIAIMISGTNMQTWNITMDGKYASIESIEIRFKALSEEIKLKKHSVAFMFAGDYCDNYYLNLEPPIFKRFFPNTPLFQILGLLSLGAEDFQEADQKITDGYRRMLELSLTILTYD